MKTTKCELCGEPMPQGEEMFRIHGFSGNCPKPPLKCEQIKIKPLTNRQLLEALKKLDEESLDCPATIGVPNGEDVSFYGIYDTVLTSMLKNPQIKDEAKTCFGDDWPLLLAFVNE